MEEEQRFITERGERGTTRQHTEIESFAETGWGRCALTIMSVAH